MTQKKELIVATITLLFFHLNTFGLNYITLSDGVWNDAVSVWSTNGTTPCSCVPPTNNSNHSIVIDHVITTTGALYIHTNGSLRVNPGDSLKSPANNIKVGANGILTVKGYLSSKKFITLADAYVELTSGVIQAYSQVNHAGTMDVNDARLFAESGNFSVQATGVINFSGAWLRVTGGNIQNDGIINLDDCCLETSGGNVFNDNIMAGIGVVYAHAGNVKNTASWSTTVDYCVGGTSFGMPMPGNCPTTISQCGAAYTLPVELIAFNGDQNGNHVDLNWVTASEVNSDFFVVQRSVDTEVWIELGSVTAAGNSTANLSYHFKDGNVPAGTNYYRLVQIDRDGTEDILPIIAVDVKGNDLEVVLAPNPGKEFFNLYSVSDLSGNQLIVVDALGRMVLTTVLNGHSHEVNTSEVHPGIYSYSVLDTFNQPLVSGRWVKK